MRLHARRSAPAYFYSITQTQPTFFSTICPNQSFSSLPNLAGLQCTDAQRVSAGRPRSRPVFLSSPGHASQAIGSHWHITSPLLQSTRPTRSPTTLSGLKVQSKLPNEAPDIPASPRRISTVTATSLRHAPTYAYPRPTISRASNISPCAHPIILPPSLSPPQHPFHSYSPAGRNTCPLARVISFPWRNPVRKNRS